jgi:hypothetical protein
MPKLLKQATDSIGMSRSLVIPACVCGLCLGRWS